MDYENSLESCLLTNVIRGTIITQPVIILLLQDNFGYLLLLITVGELPATTKTDY